MSHSHGERATKRLPRYSVAASITVVALVAVFAVFQYNSRIESDNQSSTVVNSTQMYQSSESSSLLFCVQGVGDAEPATLQAYALVTMVLADFQKHPAWQAYSGGNPVIIEQGCPGSPALLRPGVNLVNGDSDDRTIIERLRVDTFAGPAKYVFFLTPADKARAIQGDRDVRLAPQEYHFGPPHFGNTDAIYFSIEEIANVPFVRYWLAKSMSLHELLETDAPPPAGALPK